MRTAVIGQSFESLTIAWNTIVVAVVPLIGEAAIGVTDNAWLDALLQPAANAVGVTGEPGQSAGVISHAATTIDETAAATRPIRRFMRTCRSIPSVPPAACRRR